MCAFPTWGAALSCILQFDEPREGFVNDALMTAMGAPWLNTKIVVAVSPDTDIDDARDVYHAIATRLRSIARHDHRPEHARLALMILRRSRSRAKRPGASSARSASMPPRKSRHDPADFERAWPRNWGKIRLEDFL